MITLKSTHTQARIDREACQALAPAVPGRLVWTAGMLVLLDLIEHPLLTRQPMGAHDLRHALYILTVGPEAVPFVSAAVSRRGEYQEDAESDPERPRWLATLEAAASADDVAVQALQTYGVRAGASEVVALAAAIRRDFDEAFSGFGILPQSGTADAPNRRRHVFGPEWLAGIYYNLASAAPGTTWPALLWDLPLAAVGHIIAAQARAAGQKTDRPLDTSGLFDKKVKSHAGSQSKNRGGRQPTD